MSVAKYKQLFQFLKEFYQLRETTVRDITTSKKYLHTLWLSDIEPLLGRQAAKYRFPDQELEEEDLVLRIKRPKKPTEPDRPVLPEALGAWLEGPIYDLDSAPNIREAIEEGEDILLLEDFPDYEYRLDLFLRELAGWRDRQAQYLDSLQEYEEEKQVYDPLFDAYNKQESFAERYELLLGVGTFCWRGDKHYRRPILTSPLQVEVSDTGIIELRLDPTEEPFRIENDFLAEQSQFFTPQASQVLKDKLEEGAQLTYWEQLESLQNSGISAFAAKLHTEVAYRNTEYNVPETSPSDPTIHFAPVLIFRERSLRSFSALFDGILEYLDGQTDEYTLPLLNRIVFPPDQELPADEEWEVAQEELVLPKVSNAEQEEIAHRVGKKDIVLVQGPPGTGKSHTIANILTYLLSQGKKVLVTAHTDQALKALQHHVPDNFLDLVIYFLAGADKKDQHLKRSVRMLQDTVIGYRPERVEQTIKQSRQHIQELREERSEQLNDIKTLQKSDHLETSLNPHYRDALLGELTDRIRSEEKDHGWLIDPIDNLEGSLERIDDFLQWYHSWEQLHAAGFDPEAQIILPGDSLASPETLKTFNEKKARFQKEYEGKALKAEQAVGLEELEQLIEKYLELSEMLRPQDEWMKKLQEDLRQGRSQVWESMQSESSNLLRDLDQLGVDELERDYEFQIPEGIRLRQLWTDVKTVLDYARTGKKLTGILPGLFLPAEMKSRSYVYKECRVNNKVCDSIGELELLERYATALLRLTQLDKNWQPWEEKRESLRYRLETYRHRQESLSQQLEHFPAIVEAQKKLEEIFHLGPSFFESDESKYKLRDALEAFRLQSEIETLGRELEASKNFLLQKKAADPDLNLLHEHIAQRDWVAYQKGFERQKRLQEYDQLDRNRQELESSLEESFGQTIETILEKGPSESLDTERIRQAIYWAHAKTELEERFSQTVDDKFQALQEFDRKIRKAASELLKAKAVKAFLENLGNSDWLNQKLTRWEQAVRRAGGRGKRAFIHKQNARKQLAEISPEIPCWIMPMYRLVDTLGPRPEQFDVVIIDEASQLGPEAMFLMYITKKIIVVGDDQQTAPENVGVQIDQVTNLIRTHLKGVPDAEYFDTDHSFFDHMSAVAGDGKVVLREHFRCMPEIIGFSNQLCYRPEGIELVPLKQYDSRRLPPLEKRFVPKGTFAGTVNEPEGEEIIKTIQTILEDDAYEGKTIGVIALQGNHQSAYIDRKMREVIEPRDILERRIVCGSPPDFQGDERDVILMSLVTAPDHRRRAMTTDNYKRRYNVAMSRAKEQVILFHSIQETELSNTQDLRYQVMRYFSEQRINEWEEITIPYPRPISPPEPFDSWFEVDIYQELSRNGYRVEPQFQVGPYRIDLVVHLENGQKLAVECDGDRWHGLDRMQKDIDRQLILQRAGWEFFRIRYSHYRYQPEKSLEKLLQILSNREQQYFNEKAYEPTYSGSEEESTEEVDFVSSNEENEASTSSTQLNFPATESKDKMDEEPGEEAYERIDPLSPELNNFESRERLAKEETQSRSKEFDNKKTGQGHYEDPAIDPDHIDRSPKPHKPRIKITNLPDPEAAAIDQRKQVLLEKQIKIDYSPGGKPGEVSILCFTSGARVFRSSLDGPIEQLLEHVSNRLGRNEELLYAVGTQDYAGFMIFGYENGKVDRVPLSVYERKREILNNAYHNKQKLLFIKHFKEEEDLIGITYQEKVIVFSTNIITEHLTRGNQGNQIFKRGSRVKAYKILTDSRITDVDYYRRFSGNSKGYYLKSEDQF